MLASSGMVSVAGNVEDNSKDLHCEDLKSLNHFPSHNKASRFSLGKCLPTSTSLL